jgi:hypothetical protein
MAGRWSLPRLRKPSLSLQVPYHAKWRADKCLVKRSLKRDFGGFWRFEEQPEFAPQQTLTRRSCLVWGDAMLPIPVKVMAHWNLATAPLRTAQLTAAAAKQLVARILLLCMPAF